MGEPLLKVQGLETHFKTPEGTVHAVNGVSFHIKEGETLGFVGESGCGKSVTMLSCLRLIPAPPGKIIAGEAFFKGNDLLKMTPDEIRHVRGGQISMVFQDPMTSLNPVMSIGKQMAEPLMLHLNLTKEQARKRSIELLGLVGIPNAADRLKDYPHQYSGGMRQRVMIAMALACEPEILIADEPTTALDVTVQAQIFDLLRKLQHDHGTAIVMITHDMGAVAEMADRVMVMYAGRVIEQGPVAHVLGQPLHPYTQGLIACLPELGSSAGADSQRQTLPEIPGMVPSIWELGTNCAFHERCAHAQPICRDSVPPMAVHEGRTHGVACWLYDENAQASFKECAA